jgi:hypothetical protein
VVSACYDATNGQLRIVKPWGPARCIPPAPYTSDGDTTPSLACDAGGAFDCKVDEYFLTLNTTGPLEPGGRKVLLSPKVDTSATRAIGAVGATDAID